MTTSVLVQRSDPQALALDLTALIDSLPRRPEEFGAAGDGVQDDAAAIQHALNAISATGRPGTMLLTPGKRYKCGSQIVADRAFHNVQGAAILDFSSWAGTYFRWEGSLTEFGNGYGQNGSMEGQIVLLGAGGTTDSVGILYDTPVENSSTHIRTIGVTVINCGVSFQIGSRGYNQEFYNCKSFGFGVCFDWLASAEDNDERVDVFGGTFFNGGLFLRHLRPAGRLAMHGGSVDYTTGLVRINSGKAEFNSVHLESSYWTDCPISVTGDNGLLVVRGGWLLLQVNNGDLTHIVNVGTGSTVKFRDVITNHTDTVLTPDSLTPTTWATGAGRFEMSGTEPAFEFGGFPRRLHDSYSGLADGDFEAAELGQDLIWLNADTQPITSRYSGQDLQITRSTSGQYGGSACLRVDKQFGTTAAGSFILIALPVRYGDKVVAGLRVATAADRPGSDARLIFSGGFAKLDGYDANRVPIIVRFDSPGDQVTTPATGSYGLVIGENGLSQATAPSWATHWILQVNTVLAFQASWLFDGLWASTF